MMLKADGFDSAIIGVGTKFNNDSLCYDYEKCIEVLMNEHSLEYDEAVDYMEFNVVGSYVGEHTPIFVRPYIEDEYEI